MLKRTIISALLLSSFVPVFVLRPATSYGAQSEIQGYPTPATPFDQKSALKAVLKSGVRPVLTSARKPISDLFWQARKFVYIDEGKKDTWQAPHLTESKRAGDCEDKAMWLYNQLRSNGYRNVRLVVGKYRSIDRTYHMWLTYSDSRGIVYLLDPSIQRRIWKQSKFGKGFYQPAFSYDENGRYRHMGPAPQSNCGYETYLEHLQTAMRLGRKLLPFERFLKLKKSLSYCSSTHGL